MALAKLEICALSQLTLCMLQIGSLATIYTAPAACNRESIDRLSGHTQPKTHTHTRAHQTTICRARQHKGLPLRSRISKFLTNAPAAPKNYTGPVDQQPTTSSATRIRSFVFCNGEPSRRHLSHVKIASSVWSANYLESGYPAEAPDDLRGTLG